jgi:hypothetical protein
MSVEGIWNGLQLVDRRGERLQYFLMDDPVKKSDSLSRRENTTIAENGIEKGTTA